MKLYVTGGTGIVGCNIIKVARERHDAGVFATVHKRQPLPSADYDYDTVDIRDREQVLSSVRAYQPDAIVHCAIQTGDRGRYDDRALAWRTFVDATRYLGEAANEVGAKMILISTDWVYDGTQGPADEATPPNPINYYGVLKVVGETLVSTLCENWAVARVAGVNGVHWARPEQPLVQNPGFGNFISAVALAVRQGQPFDVWEGLVNMAATPTLATEIGEMIVQMVRLDRQGIFHVCGGEGWARLDLARATAEGFDADPGLVRAQSYDLAADGWPEPHRVPRDTRLNAEHTSAQLEHPLLSVQQTISELRKQMETQAI